MNTLQILSLESDDSAVGRNFPEFRERLGEVQVFRALECFSDVSHMWFCSILISELAEATCSLSSEYLVC